MNRSKRFSAAIRKAKKAAARLAPWKKIVLRQQDNQTAYLSGKRRNDD